MMVTTRHTALVVVQMEGALGTGLTNQPDNRNRGFRSGNGLGHVLVDQVGSSVKACTAGLAGFDAAADLSFSFMYSFPNKSTFA